MANITLQLYPADVLMFRETRWFGTGAGASNSTFPVPRTIAGAVRALMLDACGIKYKDLRDAMREARKSHKYCFADDYMATLQSKLRELCDCAWAVDATITGPFLSNKDSRYFPLPKSIVKVTGEIPGSGSTGFTESYAAALKPVEVALHSDKQWLMTLGKPVIWENYPEAFITKDSLEKYLNGEGLDKLKPIEQQDIIANEPRVGVGINADTLTSQEGLLYTSTFMRLKDGWHIEVDINIADDDKKKLEDYISQHPWVRLGGESKVARVSGIIDKPWIPWERTTKENERSLIYLATPSVFDRGMSIPNDWQGKIARAITGKPLSFSGWDLAMNRPMYSRYAVPAGAVYFLNEEQSFHGTCISTDSHDQQAGWGYCLQGAW